MIHYFYAKKCNLIFFRNIQIVILVAQLPKLVESEKKKLLEWLF